MNPLHLLAFFLFLPFLLVYVVLCLTVPLLRFGKVRAGRGFKIHIVGDAIHSDYVFPSGLFDEFARRGKYVKVGWGDRRIFLETRTWGELKILDFIRAFFGLNPTVLRVEHLDDVPVGAREIEIGADQLESLEAYVRSSFSGEPIERGPEDYQGGQFYRSDLKYNCFTNCNNWVNGGLRAAGATNRVWAPLSFWII